MTQVHVSGSSSEKVPKGVPGADSVLSGKA